MKFYINEFRNLCKNRIEHVNNANIYINCLIESRLVVRSHHFTGGIDRGNCKFYAKSIVLISAGNYC